MIDVNNLAVVVAAVAAVIVSTLYYLIFAKARAALSAAAAEGGRPAPWKVLVELIRSLLLAYIVAHLVVLIGVVDMADAWSLAFWLWLAFPVVLLSGSVVWEKVPWKLAAIHAGDWLIKLVLISAIVTKWQ